MIKALIFDCLGVLYTGPLFAEGNDYNAVASPMMGTTALEADLQFFHSSKRNDQLLEFAQEMRSVRQIGLLSRVGGNTLDALFSPTERQQLFDETVIGTPDQTLLEGLCTRMDVLPNEVVIVSNTQVACDTAKAAGMQSVYYIDFEQCKSELVALFNDGQAAS